MRPITNVATVLGPAALLLVPKCPLCLLPLLAAAGIAAPPNRVLNAIIAIVVIGWGSLLFTVTTSALLRACGVILAAFIVAGRILAVPALTWIGIALMVSVAFGATLRCRASSACGSRHR